MAGKNRKFCEEEALIEITVDLITKKKFQLSLEKFEFL